MSMGFDLRQVFINAAAKGLLTKDQAAEMYGDVLSAVEWDLEEEVEGEWTPEKYHEACKKEMFGTED